MDIGKWISKKDALAMMDIIDSSLSCTDGKDFLDLMDQFKQLVFFECSISGCADIQSVLQGKKVNTSYINAGYPDEYLSVYINKGYHLQDPVIQEFYKTFEILNFIEVDQLVDDIDKNPVVRFSYDFGLFDGFIYGVCSPDLSSATAFFLTGHHVENDQRSRIIIKHIVPHLSEAMKCFLPFTVSSGNDFNLTPAELEVLNWIKEGKSSWEISMILKKSERTINFHALNIMTKLNAMNRTHAVAIAFQNNLLDL